MTHKRNTSSMLSSPRCGAKTRGGRPCQAPAISGSKRCRMHGGRGSGAPMQNQNAVKSGLHTAEMKHLRRMLRSEIQLGERLLEDVEDELSEHKKS